MSSRCIECREDLLARDAGELSTIRQERVDAHLRGCASCRAFRAELGSLLAAGRAFAPAPTPEERDTLYDAVAKQARGAPPRSPRPDRRWLAGAVALAASMALAVLGIGLLGGDTPHPSAARHSAARRAAPPPVAPPSLPEPVAVQDGALSSPEPGLYVRADTGGRWEFDRAGHRIALREGAIWISYEHGASSEPLIAEGPGVRVTVTGTVLFLRANREGTDVGVLQGRVVVEPAWGAAAPVRAGRVRLASGQIRPVRQDETDPASAWLSAHAPAARSPAAPTPPTTAGPPGPAALYHEAEDALAARDPGHAADLLRRLVQTWPMSPESGTARLELARLYAGPLHRPELAVAQLRRFLTSSRAVASESPAGGDAAAVAARSELCRLLPADERGVEPSCAQSASQPTTNSP